MRWMFDIQLGRRNLSSFQRIAVVEKNALIMKRKRKKNRQNIMVINMTKKWNYTKFGGSPK